MKKYTKKTFSPNASDLNHQAYKDGCKYYQKNHFSRAKVSFKEALEYWPLDSQAWMALGNCYDELGNPTKAEKCFRKALKYSSKKNRESIIYNLGNSLFDQEQYSSAIECYLQIEGQSDEYRQAQINIALANGKMIDMNK